MRGLGPGEVLAGRFRLLDLIGKGVLGSVWKAQDLDGDGDCSVAIKVLTGNFAKDGARRRRFLHSARQMAKLRHHGIVRVLEAHGEDADEYCFYVMELVECQKLRCGQARALPAREKLQIVLEVGSALSYAHEKGIVHRCLNPTNILLSSDGRAIVSDFDLARAVDFDDESGVIRVVDVAYVAPEVQRAAEAGRPADVYALGMIALYLWHDTKLKANALNGYLAADLAWRLPICEAARVAVARAVDREPGNRWSSVLQFCDELDAAFNGRSWTTPSERLRMINWLRPKLSSELERRHPSLTAEQRDELVATVLRPVESDLARWQERPLPDNLLSYARRVMEREISEVPSRSLHLGHRIERCLELLPTPERLVVTLHLHGTEFKAAARILGWTVREARARLERGLRRLHDCLGDGEPPEMEGGRE